MNQLSPLIIVKKNHHYANWIEYLRNILFGRFACNSTKIFSAIVVSLTMIVLLLPPLMYWMNGISLIAVANESLSYRYFYSMRLLSGESNYIVLPQGHILTILQHGFNLFLTHIMHLKPNDLWKRMEFFGYISLFFASFLNICILGWIGKSKKVEVPIKILLSTAFITFCYASRSGLSAFSTPDYASFEAILTMAAICLFIYNRKIHTKNTSKLLIPTIGIFSAILLAVKISLLFVALFPLLALLNIETQQSRIILIKLLSQSFLWFLVSIFFLLCLFYCFDFKNMFASLSIWGNFLANPGSEPNFWKNLLGSLYGKNDPATNYSYAWFIIFASILIQLFIFITSFKARQSEKIIISALLLVSSLIHLYFLYHRPAGTTLWEACLYLTACACIALIINIHLKKTIWSYCAFLALISLGSSIINFSAVLDINRFKDSSRAIYDIHAFNASQPKMLAIIPDNDYTTGTVEEGLMKGTSDFPTWNISEGQKLLDYTVPGLTFARDGSQITRDTAIFWINIPGKSIPLDVASAIDERNSQNPSLCRKWHVETWKWRLREVIVCKAFS